MRKTWVGKLALVLALAAGLMLAVPAGNASAEVGKKGDLGIGGDIGLGGAVNSATSSFAFGLTPYLSYHPIDNLAIFTRMPFWEGYFGTVDTHVFPFLFGARYYIPTPVDKLRGYVGGALGFSILHTSVSAFGFSASSDVVRFSMDFNGGVEYEVIDNLGISGGLDIFIPNVESGATARIGVMGGVVYYLPVL
jgi:hypothetical protein